MGQANKRGTFEQRKEAAIAAGRTPQALRAARTQESRPHVLAWAIQYAMQKQRERQAREVPAHVQESIRNAEAPEI
jgi:membrane-bound lytic murein transglycosylase B